MRNLQFTFKANADSSTSQNDSPANHSASLGMTEYKGDRIGTAEAVPCYDPRKSHLRLIAEKL